MVLLRIASAVLVFIGVYLGMLEFKQAPAIGVVLIVLGLIAMFVISRLERRAVPHRGGIPARQGSPRQP